MWCDMVPLNTYSRILQLTPAHTRLRKHMAPSPYRKSLKMLIANPLAKPQVKAPVKYAPQIPAGLQAEQPAAQNLDDMFDKIQGT